LPKTLDRFAPLRFASTSVASHSSASDRFVSARTAPVRSAFARLVRLRSPPLRSAFRRYALERLGTPLGLSARHFASKGQNALSSRASRYLLSICCSPVTTRQPRRPRILRAFEKPFFASTDRDHSTYVDASVEPLRHGKFRSSVRLYIKLQK